MKICIPIGENKGIKSKVSSHYGSAPYFLIYDTDSSDFHVVNNTDTQHSHGACQPLGVLQDYHIDAVICRGMGARAVQRLYDAGITAYSADGQTAEALIAQHKQGALNQITLENACKQHRCG